MPVRATVLPNKCQPRPNHKKEIERSQNPLLQTLSQNIDIKVYSLWCQSQIRQIRPKPNIENTKPRNAGEAKTHHCQPQRPTRHVTQYVTWDVLLYGMKYSINWFTMPEMVFHRLAFLFVIIRGGVAPALHLYSWACTPCSWGRYNFSECHHGPKVPVFGG